MSKFSRLWNIWCFADTDTEGGNKYKNKHMVPHAQCSLRTHRRLWGLKQDELAMLLGVRGADQISRLERGERIPTLKVALACELLFDQTPADLFAQVREPVEEFLIRRIYAMYERLIKETGAATTRKLELIEACRKRLVVNIKNNDL